MNVQDLSALAETKVKEASGALKDFRAKNLRVFTETGFSELGEAYKFTNLKRFFEELPSEVSPQFAPETDEDAFVFVNGKLAQAPRIEGVKLSPLTTFAFTDENQLSPLHHGLMAEAWLLEVEKNTDVKAPVKIIYVGGTEEITTPTLTVRLGANSRMTLLERTVATRSNFAEVSECRVELSPGAKLEHIQLGLGTEASLTHGSTWAHVPKDATYSNLIFHLAGKLQRRNLDVKLTEVGSHAESYALFLTSGEEHSDVNTVIHHLHADTTSNQIAKGILGGSSKGVFTGKIHIHPKAQRVASGQINRNLLLSPKAHVHSQPQLEIFADDVKCSHGSTTGQLSPDEIFYFEARGIPAEKARTLLAFGFGLEVVQKIQNADARKLVEKAVMDALKTKFQLKLPSDNLGGMA